MVTYEGAESIGFPRGDSSSYGPQTTPGMEYQKKKTINLTAEVSHTSQLLRENSWGPAGTCCRLARAGAPEAGPPGFKLAGTEIGFNCVGWAILVVPVPLSVCLVFFFLYLQVF